MPRRNETALSMVHFALALVCVAPGPFSAWTTPLAPSPALDSPSILQLSRAHMEKASAAHDGSVDVMSLGRGVSELMPVVRVLASFVSTPLGRDADNLQSAAGLAINAGHCARPPCSSVDLGALVKNEEAIARDYRGHRPVAASAYWSLLFLDFFERIIEGVLERKDRTLATAAREHDKRADEALRESARAAYAKSYAPHHNRVVRAIANKVFDFLPTREVFYRALGDAGTDRKRWDRDLKRDLEQYLSALRPTVRRLKSHFKAGAPPGA